MIKKMFVIVFLSCFGFSIGQDNSFNSEEIGITQLVDGTLLLPSTSEKIPLAIIIAGSGPTDRNGNQNGMKNNSLRFLAEALYANGIASFRYDKRIVKLMKKGKIIEKKISFNHFIEDAIQVTKHFKEDPRFSKIYIIGHSQGSLIGMIAAQNRANGFISLAGAGQTIDAVIVAQLAKQVPGLKDNARSAFDDLRINGIALNYSPGLSSIFREDIQPFIYSWMQYNPKEELAKLKVPVLIINGDKDLQVQPSESELLKDAKKDAQLEIITNMNHVLKEIKGDDLENSKSYNEYNRPVMPEVIEKISQFILH